MMKVEVYKGRREHWKMGHWKREKENRKKKGIEKRK